MTYLGATKRVLGSSGQNSCTTADASCVMKDTERPRRPGRVLGSTTADASCTASSIQADGDGLVHTSLPIQAYPVLAPKTKVGSCIQAYPVKVTSRELTHGNRV